MTPEWIFTVVAVVKMPTVICTRKAIPPDCSTDQIISPNTFISNLKVLSKAPPTFKEGEPREAGVVSCWIRYLSLLKRSQVYTVVHNHP